MRIARPTELRKRAIPAFTARVSESELSKWFPVSFQELDDPDEVPEPSKGVLLRLDSGPFAVLFYGLVSKQLTVRFAEGTDVSDSMKAFFAEVPLPESRILWRAPGTLGVRGAPSKPGVKAAAIAYLPLGNAGRRTTRRPQAKAAHATRKSDAYAASARSKSSSERTRSKSSSKKK